LVGRRFSEPQKTRRCTFCEAFAFLLFLAQVVLAQQPTPILPDSKLTPGDTFDLTAQDVRVPGYAKKVRAVPAWLKRQAYVEYASIEYKTGDYEVDHLIPLASEAGISSPGAFAGAPEFASPEQFAGVGVDIRSDLYSLCITKAVVRATLDDHFRALFEPKAVFRHHPQLVGWNEACRLKYTMERHRFARQYDARQRDSVARLTRRSAGISVSLAQGHPHPAAARNAPVWPCGVASVCKLRCKEEGRRIEDSYILDCYRC